MQRKIAARNITEGVIWKQLLFFFFPILLGTFFQQMYNTVDTIIVGRFVGTQALAAVGSTSALINLLNGFFVGLLESPIARRIPAPILYTIEATAPQK